MILSICPHTYLYTFKCASLYSTFYQHWHITKDHLLKNDDVCIQAAGENENGNLATLEKCNGNVKEQVNTLAILDKIHHLVQTGTIC